MGDLRVTTSQNRQDLLTRLTDGIAGLTSSEQWRRYLDFQCRFHQYSFGNVLLIANQYQGATRVAGFNAWRRLNRFVRKGEQAIWIIAPMVYKDASEDAVAGDRLIRGFKFVPVFDVTQTDGEELPSVCVRLDGHDPAGCYASLLKVARSLGFDVEDHSFSGDTNGDCCHADHRIRVEAANSSAQRLKTLAHELAHAVLHENSDNRALAELEAESTAYIVCQTLGIDSSSYTFGYVTTWAGGGNQAIAGIKASGDRIQKTASAIVELSGLRPSTPSHEGGHETLTSMSDDSRARTRAGNLRLPARARPG